MKLKCQPEDFRVEELPDVAPRGDGRFILYRLEKRGLGTLEALEAIRRRWDIAANRVAYGGLKDRHAETLQYLTILGGPERSLVQTNFRLEPVGRLPHPYGPRFFRGNRFTVVLRDMKPPELAQARDAAEAAGREGVPNYFDDQRFGSVGHGGAFIAEAWIRGDLERALYLALAEPNPRDRPDTREEKAILRDCWNRWPDAKARLPRSHARSLVTYLADHPTDYKGAFARHDRALRSLYFSAYQSHLWNLVLGKLIERVARPEQRIEVEFETARLPLHRDLDAEQVARLDIPIPLPAARQPIPAGELGEIVAEVLGARGLGWDDLRVRGLKDVFLSKGSRPALLHPFDLTAEPSEDALYPGRQALTLAFELPRGAYATLLVKRLTLVGPET